MSIKTRISAPLVNDWEELADQIEIPLQARQQFRIGREAQGVWEWLELRGRLGELPGHLEATGRTDLANLLREEDPARWPPAALAVRRYQRVLTVTDRDGLAHQFTLHLPALSQQDAKKALKSGKSWKIERRARAWKQLHTVTERLYTSLRIVYIDMERYYHSKTIAHRESALRIFCESVRNEVVEFCDALDGLPLWMRQLELIAHLARLRVIPDMVEESLQAEGEFRVFEEGYTLIEYVCRWLLEGLRVADNVLEAYFETVSV
jgi:hypothetical protein